MDILVLLIIIGTSVWVFIDAKTIGIKKGQIPGIANLGPGGWLAACLLLWIISFPLYLEKRGAFKKANGQDPGQDQMKRYAGWVMVCAVVLLIGVPFFLNNGKAPSCDDSEVKKTVTSIFMKEAKFQVRQNSERAARVSVSDANWDSDWEKIAQKMVVRIENIRVKDFKKDTGAYLCAADLHYDLAGESQTLPITYTSELAVDKKGQFYVEVYGIR